MEAPHASLRASRHAPATHDRDESDVHPHQPEPGTRPHPRPRLPHVLRAALVLAGFLGIAALLNLAFGPDRAVATTDAPDDAMIARGSEVFGQRCVICHGVEGRGVSAESNPSNHGPNIQDVGLAGIDFVIRTGRMPLADPSDPVRRKAQQLTDDEREALLAFAATWVEGPEIPPIGDWQSAELARGLEAFTNNCAACHGPTAAGIAVGQSDVSSNLDVATPLEIAEAVRYGPGVMPLFGHEVLEEEDLQAIVRWVVDLRDRESPGGINVGRSGPVTEGLIAWIIGIGGLAVIMYLLGQKTGDEHE